MPKTAIIVGASTGIGESLDVFIQQMDVTCSDRLEAAFSALANKMGPIDLVIISAGTGHRNPELSAELECNTIDTNVTGFTVIAGIAYRYFAKQGHGHIVGISSIMALRGGAYAPAYNASKAYVSNYMQGLRVKALKEKSDIIVTDIRPGYVDTKMAEGATFWMAPVNKAATQIIKAIDQKKSYAYITKRWRLIAWVLKIMPDCLYQKF